MIKIGQFTTPENSSLLHAAKMALHLRNQKSEKLLSLQKRFCADANPGGRVVFVESLVLLYALDRISYDGDLDRIVYRENT